MTKKLMFILGLVLIFGMFALNAANGFKNGSGNGECIFIDENGDGINDNFRDHDGDGIPNFEDPDWIRPQDGTGYGSGQGKMNGKRDGTGKRYNSMRGNQSGFASSFQMFNNFGGNYGAGVCDDTGLSTGRGRGRRGGR